jgi:uncharacterized Tic20 family protein
MRVIFPPIPPISFRPIDDPNPEPDSKARLWAALCHLAGVLVFGFVTALLIIYLVQWIIENRQHPFVEDQGREAINFQTTMLVCLGVMFLAPAPGLVLVLLVVDVIFMVRAAREAHNGRHYRYPYPLTIIRLAK